MASPLDPSAPEPNDGHHEDGFCPPSRSVDSALLSAFTNSGYDLPAKSENVPANHGPEATIPSVESTINTEHSNNSGPDAGKPLTRVEQNNCANADITPSAMSLLTASFEPDPPSVALKSNSNDPILFTLEDWENISCAADPSTSALVTNGVSTPGSSRQLLEMHSQRRDDCQLHMTSCRDPSTPPPAHFPIATNSNLVDPNTGRRRSQSVPPQMPTFARRLENGNIRQIGIPTTPLATPDDHNTRPNISYMAQPFLAISRSTTDPYFAAHPNTLDVMTVPSVPAPYAHIQPAISHQKGLVSCKRSFHRHCEQASDSDRARPEPKRRNQRKKTDPTLSSFAGGPMGTLQVEPILENLRAMLQSRFEELRSGRFEELEM